MRQQLIEFYLAFRNEFLTIERFASWQNLSYDQALQLVNLGRDLWTENKQGL